MTTERSITLRISLLPVWIESTERQVSKMLAKSVSDRRLEGCENNGCNRYWRWHEHRKVEPDSVVTQLAHLSVSTAHYSTVDTGYCSKFVLTE
jgi:hypothetical protein